MRLSILICTVYERVEKFKALHTHLKKINSYHDVEILYEVDNKEISVGAKRQKLLERAKGDFVVFIDDDDWVSDYYIEEIMNAIVTNPKIDCVGFLIECTFNGLNKSMAKSSIVYKTWEDNRDGYRYVRSIYHKNPVRREIALKAGFPDKRFAEDHDYSMSLQPHLKTEKFIDKVMYYYYYKHEDHKKKYGIK